MVEKETFQILLQVSGIGPKLAVAVLTAMVPTDFARAILTDNLTALTKISGVGKKTAERMCLELKDKVTFIPTAGTAPVISSSETEDDTLTVDGVSALMNLGYSEMKARDAVNHVLRGGKELDLQDLIRQALRSLA